MANNHGVDFGPVGLRDILAAKRAGPIPIVGIGANEDEAFAPATLSAKGGHSHRVNGAGWLGDAYVGYGLGNFVWWRSQEPDSRTGVLTLSVDVKRATAATPPPGPVVRKALWTPMLIGRDGIPEAATGADATRLLGQWKQARRCAGLAARP